MKRFLICAGVDGKAEALEWLRHLVQERQPDAVLFAGGILGTLRERDTAGGASLWSLALEDVRFVGGFFSTLGGLGVFSAVIPGARGELLEDILRQGMHAEMLYPDVHVVHATLVASDGVAVCGLGGSLAERGLLGIDACTRVIAEFFLRPLWRCRQPRKILLLASPPPGALGGPEGESLAGDLIDSFHPDLCVVGSGGARPGCERIGNTLVINPGRLGDGRAAWLDWGKPARDRVAFLERSAPEQPLAVVRGVRD